jgi:hypothetical protein
MIEASMLARGCLVCGVCLRGRILACNFLLVLVLCSVVVSDALDEPVGNLQPSSELASRFVWAGSSWCERGDLNPHGFTRQILSLVRLPIPPLSHSWF